MPDVASSGSVDVITTISETPAPIELSDVPGSCNFNDGKSKTEETPQAPDVVPPAPVELDAIDKIRNFFEAKFNLGGTSLTGGDDGDRDRVLKTVDLDGLVEHWKAGGFKRIVTMVGAGISTCEYMADIWIHVFFSDHSYVPFNCHLHWSTCWYNVQLLLTIDCPPILDTAAGIPDFRSPGTGLYNNLRKYKLPYPTAIFDIDYFVHQPKPFFALAKELYPGQFLPTPCHYFIRLLHDKGQLHRHYTQNIDTLDRIAGIPDAQLVEAHGTFHTNHCVKCRHEYTQTWMKAQIFGDRLPKCERCAALVKPDIVFFGENLPERFYELPERDLGTECDLLIVMGTSLEVHPFAGLVDMVGDRCVRLLINREAVGVGGRRGEGFQFGLEGNRRDVLWEGDCDEGIWWLADQLGWKAELEELIRVEGERIEEEKSGSESEAKGVNCDCEQK